MKTKLEEFIEYFDKHCAPRLAEINRSQLRVAYQVWTRGTVPGHPEIETPVIRESRIYLNRELAEKSQTQFTDKTYLVEYPVS